MNRWAANNPELYEHLGHEGYIDYFREWADDTRKRQKEEGDPPVKPTCATCGEPTKHPGLRCGRCTASMEQDRLERESGR